jgi:hypothetical protein
VVIARKRPNSKTRHALVSSRFLNQKELDPDFVDFNSVNRRCHYHARSYAPFRGAFLQVEPLAQHLTLPSPGDSVGIYRYAGMDARPTRLVDPAGLQATPRDVGYLGSGFGVGAGIPGIGFNAGCDLVATFELPPRGCLVCTFCVLLGVGYGASFSPEIAFGKGVMETGAKSSADGAIAQLGIGATVTGDKSGWSATVPLPGIGAFGFFGVAHCWSKVLWCSPGAREIYEWYFQHPTAAPVVYYGGSVALGLFVLANPALWGPAAIYGLVVGGEATGEWLADKLSPGKDSSAEGSGLTPGRCCFRYSCSCGGCNEERWEEWYDWPCRAPSLHMRSGRKTCIQENPQGQRPLQGTCAENGKSNTSRFCGS